MQSNQQILPVDEAFKLSAVKRDGKIDLFWQIEPGYYLYRHRLKFSSGKDNLQAQMPAGQEKTDEFYGAVEVYYEQLDVSLPDPKGTITDLMVEYQGCADAGICYPPEKRQIEL